MDEHIAVPSLAPGTNERAVYEQLGGSLLTSYASKARYMRHLHPRHIMGAHSLLCSLDASNAHKTAVLLFAYAANRNVRLNLRLI